MKGGGPYFRGKKEFVCLGVLITKVVLISEGKVLRPEVQD